MQQKFKLSIIISFILCLFLCSNESKCFEVKETYIPIENYNCYFSPSGKAYIQHKNDDTMEYRSTKDCSLIKSFSFKDIIKEYDKYKAHVMRAYLITKNDNLIYGINCYNNGSEEGEFILFKDDDIIYQNYYEKDSSRELLHPSNVFCNDDKTIIFLRKKCIYFNEQKATPIIEDCNYFYVTSNNEKIFVIEALTNVYEIIPFNDTKKLFLQTEEKQEIWGFRYNNDNKQCSYTLTNLSNENKQTCSLYINNEKYSKTFEYIDENNYVIDWETNTVLYFAAKNENFALWKNKEKLSFDFNFYQDEEYGPNTKNSGIIKLCNNGDIYYFIDGFMIYKNKKLIYTCDRRTSYLKPTYLEDANEICFCSISDRRIKGKITLKYVSIKL